MASRYNAGNTAKAPPHLQTDDGNTPMEHKKLQTFDSTLRDGAQGANISFSVDDKLNVIYALDRLGIDFIEAGNPYSNPA